MPKEPDHLAAEIARLKGEIARMTLEVVRLEAIREGRERLQAREQRVTVNKVDAAAHAFATSRGRSGDALVQAANNARLTMTELAKKVGVSKAALSMARRGERKIRQDVAESIQKLTGFKATSTNWPAGFSPAK